MIRSRFVAISALLISATVAARPLDRLSGRVLSERGDPIKDADVRVAAIFGFAGSDFLGQILVDAAEAARAGRPERVAPLLARLADSHDATMLVTAGRIRLLMRDATVARPFFRRARDRDPGLFGAALGMGSTALMQRDVDAAARAFSEARNRTKDKDDRRYLGPRDRRAEQGHNVMRGTY
jgi:hypothetical protein